ncbi:nicotinamide N-methyltransferase-like [Lissotriton helveticus]
MASPTDLKALYNQQFNPRKMMELYMSAGSPFIADSCLQAVPYLKKLVPSGAEKGATLLEISFVPFVHCALPASEYFHNAYFACPNDKTIEEVHKWMQGQSGALDITHLITFIIGLLENSLQSIFGISLGGETEAVVGSLLGAIGKVLTPVASVVEDVLQKKFRKEVKNVVECDVTSSSPVPPTVPTPVDCLALSYILENFSTDEKSFIKLLNNVSTLLKPGGCLIIYACLGATFYKVDHVRFPLFCIKDDFLRKALVDEGYIIKEFHIFKRKTEGSYDVMDFQSCVILSAYKKNEI